MDGWIGISTNTIMEPPLAATSDNILKFKPAKDQSKSNTRHHRQASIRLSSISKQNRHLERFDKDKLENLNIAKCHVLQS